MNGLKPMNFSSFFFLLEFFKFFRGKEAILLKKMQPNGKRFRCTELAAASIYYIIQHFSLDGAREVKLAV
jgi:hypothetical protein